jgi:hypothetical protein
MVPWAYIRLTCLLTNNPLTFNIFISRSLETPKTRKTYNISTDAHSKVLAVILFLLLCQVNLEAAAICSILHYSCAITQS